MGDEQVRSKDMKDIVSRRRVADISVSGAGQITLNKATVEALRLEPGDVVTIGEEQGEWYLYRLFRSSEVRGQRTGRLQRVTRHGRTLRMHSRALAMAIRRRMGLPDWWSRVVLYTGERKTIDGKECLTVIMRVYNDAGG